MIYDEFDWLNSIISEYINLVIVILVKFIMPARVKVNHCDFFQNFYNE